MQRWHGRIGDATAGDGAMLRCRVRLRGTPLDELDAAGVHARLDTPAWALERVTSVVVYGLWPGDGQLWTPDPRARVFVLDAPFARGASLPECIVGIETTLTRDALAQRLRQAFARDRLVEVEVDDELP